MASSNQNLKKSLLKKRWVQILLTVVLLTIVFFISLPFVTKLYLTDWLEKHGADTAQIESMSFNPFTARLTIKGVDVTKGGQSLLKNSSAVVDIGLRALVNRDVRVEKAEYIDLALDLEQFADGSWRLGSVVLQNNVEESAEENPPQSDMKNSPQWGVLADHLLLTNCAVNLKTPELDFKLLLEKGELIKFTTHENEAAANLYLKGKLNNKPFLIELKDLQVRPSLSFNGEILVNGFELNELEMLLSQALPVFTGTTDIEGKVVFVMEDGGAIRVDYDGKINLAEGQLGRQGFDTAAGNLNWQGKVEYRDKKSEPILIRTNGTLSAREYSLQLPETNFATRQGGIDFTGTTEVVIGDNLSVRHDGSLLVEDVEVGVSEQTVEGNHLPAEGQPGRNGFDTAADNLNWQGIVEYSAKKSEPILIKTNGTLSARKYSLQLHEANFTTRQGGIDFTGATEVVVGDNVSVRHDGSLLADDVEVELPEQTVKEKQLRWQGKSHYDSSPDEKGLFVKTDGHLELGPVNYDSQAGSGMMAAGVDNVSWQGALRVGEQSDKAIFLEIDGIFTGRELLANLSEPQFQFSQESLKLQTNTRIGFGNDIEIAGQNSLDLNKFTLIAGQDAKPLIYIDTFNVKDFIAETNNKIRIGELSAQEIESNLSGDMPLKIDVSQIQMQGLLVDQFVALSSDALVVDDINVSSILNNKELAQLQQLKLNDIQFDEQKRMEIGDVELSNFNALAQEDGPQQHVVTLGHAVLEKINWESAQGLTGEQLRLENLQAVLVRDKAGEFTVNAQLKDMKKADPDTPKQEVLKSADVKLADSGAKGEKDASAGTAIRLKEFVATGENSIVFQDYSLAVPYITDLVIDEMRVTDIDTSNPENQMKLLLKGEFEKRAPIAVSGTVSPFGEKTAMDIKLSLKNYPLTSLSSYTVQSVGTALSGGQLKVKSKIKLANDELNMKNEVDLRKLKTKTISPELAAELNNQLPIPLDAALGLLRDSKDDISLSIPFSGPLSDLNVGISDVLITALSKAIVPAASGYLMYALGPYGALAYVGAKVGEKMLEVKLPPVKFDPQLFEITEEHREYLERIGTILTDRPQMDLQICPRVPAWEFLSEKTKAGVTTSSYPEPVEKEREQLLALGQQRGVAIQTYLAKKHGIEITRLLICDTVIERAKKSTPQVVLQI